MHTFFNAFSPVASLLGRVLIAFMFVMAGINKTGNYAGTSAYFESLGLPAIFTAIVIALEIIGGLAIVLGWQTRLFALLLAGFTVLAAIIGHSNFSDQTQMLMFMKNISIAGGFLVLVAQGAGSISLDHKFK